jgi:hypothetical protein
VNQGRRRALLPKPGLHQLDDVAVEAKRG